MDETTIALSGLAVSILVASTGWLVAYTSKRKHDSRLAQLDRVNRQLRELYGPLYIGLEAANRTWNSFWENYKPSHGEDYYFGPSVEVTDDEKRVWRIWLENVFEPMNAKAEAILTNSIDLFDSDEIPDAFIDALAHIAAYRAVLAQWKESDFSEHTSVNNWPREELIAIVKPAYDELRERQRELLDT
ncbi:MAG: hypothetical protein ABJ308_16615 [Halieaceae bacterium]